LQSLKFISFDGFTLLSVVTSVVALNKISIFKVLLIKLQLIYQVI